MRVKPLFKSSDSNRKSGGLDARAGTRATFGRNRPRAQSFSSKARMAADVEAVARALSDFGKSARATRDEAWRGQR